MMDKDINKQTETQNTTDAASNADQPSTSSQVNQNLDETTMEAVDSIRGVPPVKDPM